MDRNGSYDKSWADQWDSNPDQHLNNSQVSHDSKSSKYGKKVGQGLGKTKAVASVGYKKMKKVTFVCSRWIKQKYQARVNKTKWFELFSFPFCRKLLFFRASMDLIPGWSWEDYKLKKVSEFDSFEFVTIVHIRFEFPSLKKTCYVEASAELMLFMNLNM